LEDYKPIYGKTYSLFGQETNTELFYRKIKALTDEIISQLSLPEARALEYIQRLSRNQRKLKAAAAKSAGYSTLTDMLHRIDPELAEYLPGLRQHRIALLPYCLKETQIRCKASPDEIDFVCRGCLKTCAISKLSNVLRDSGINPYILSRGSLKSIFSKLLKKHGSIGVLGVACLVELIQGMRFCMKAKLPVMGIPLNANRCPRWMGRFLDTSVDLLALDNILK
jgi:hypothetical protein